MRTRKELEDRIVDLWKQYLTTPHDQMGRYAAGAACIELVWALDLNEDERQDLYNQAREQIVEEAEQ